MSKPKVFISYCHKDHVWKEKLLKFTEFLHEGGDFETWDDRQIAVGDDWFKKMKMPPYGPVPPGAYRGPLPGRHGGRFSIPSALRTRENTRVPAKAEGV